MRMESTVTFNLGGGVAQAIARTARIKNSHCNDAKVHTYERV